MLGHLTYLAIILIPGVPGILLTWFLGWNVLAQRWKKILAIASAMTFYLVAADLLAIHVLQIWSFRAEFITGVRIANLYIEEWVLFIVTQTLIVSWAFMAKEKAQVIQKIDSLVEDTKQK